MAPMRHSDWPVNGLPGGRAANMSCTAAAPGAEDYGVLVIKTKKRITVLHQNFCDVLGELGNLGVDLGHFQLIQKA
jgi:hypothetical protein